MTHQPKQFTVADLVGWVIVTNGITAAVINMYWMYSQ